MSRYILDVDDQRGTYRQFPNWVSALHGAYARALKGHTATVVQVDGPADDLTFTPLATVTPPVVPTFSTSPGGTA